MVKEPENCHRRHSSAVNWTLYFAKPVLSVLFGQSKSKKPSDSGSATEADSDKSRRGKKSGTKSRSGKSTSAASDSDHAESHDSDKDHSTAESEQEEKHDGTPRQFDGAKKNRKPANKARKRSRKRHAQENSEGEASKPSFFKIPVKDPRVIEYLDTLIIRVIDKYRPLVFMNDIYPEDLREVVQQEEVQTRFLLEILTVA